MANVDSDMDEDEGSSSDDNVEERCGMKQPPLLKQLKTILAEYPDDGQIIKELVQNAEDAGASVMKILYDGRTLNPMQNKKLSYNKFFKAPALCFFNDSQFSEKDWEGIMMIYSSVKEQDPLKVGRFGLGFKSVFHLTDFPCILSGDRVLFLNPLEQPDSVCTTIRLHKIRKCRKLKVDDMIKSMSGLFGFTQETIDTGQFEGTVFWFPLRDAPSKLSDNLYNWEKVQDLFKSYRSEATDSLLFLRHLLKVEMFCKDTASEFDLQMAVPFFSVEINDPDQSVEADRKKLVEKIKSIQDKTESEDIASTTIFEVVTRSITTNSQQEVVRCQWMVVNEYIVGEMSDEFRELLHDQELSYSPYVGVAISLNDATEFKGHVFCFLPLPQEKKSLTGLPVHLNAFFALSQNRRHIKWASADQIENQTHKDKAVRWNECLLGEVFPKVYQKLLEEMIRYSIQKGNPTSLVNAVYRSLPDSSVVDSRWEILVKKLMSLILRIKFIYTSKQNGCWCRYDEVLFTMFAGRDVPKQIEESVQKVVSKYVDVKEAKVPEHVWKCLSQAGPKDVSPSAVAEILKSAPLYVQDLNFDERLHLIDYLMSENNEQSAENVVGLELLSVEDGSWLVFESEIDSTDEKIYIGTDDEIDLFPGLEYKFVNKLLATRDYAPHLCSYSRNQISRLTLEATVVFLRETILRCIQPMPKREKRYSGDQDDNVDEVGEAASDPFVLKKCRLPWLQKVWKYIDKYYSEGLVKFLDLHLFPSLQFDDLGHISQVHLYQMNNQFLLKSPLKKQHRGFDIPQDVCDALEKLGVVIVPGIPDWFVQEYEPLALYFPEQADVLRLLASLKKQNFPNFGSWFNTSSLDCQRKALVKYIGSINVSSDFNDDCKSLLRDLKLFNQRMSISGETTFVALTENDEMIQETDLPVNFHKQLIVPCSQEEKKLVQILGGKEIHLNALITSVLNKVEEGNYSEEDTTLMMKWLLTKWHEFEGDDNLWNIAKSIQFIPTADTKLKKASDLFDIHDQRLTELFYGEPLFPVGVFSSTEYTPALRKLGLKTYTDIETKDLLPTALLLDELSVKDENNAVAVLKKATAFFQYLQSNPDTLHEQVGDGNFGVCLDRLRCIPHVRERPNNYPDFLPWHGGKSLLSMPTVVRSSRLMDIAGSVQDFVQLDSSSKVCEYYNWNKMPEVDIVVAQFNVVIDNYESKRKPSLLPIISRLYEALEEMRIGNTSFFKASLPLNKLLEKECIWWGDGFCLPSQIVIERQKDDVTNLQPYVNYLPPEFEALKELFCLLGCNERQDIRVMLQVQQSISLKHDKKNNTDSQPEEVKRDLKLIVSVLEWLALKVDDGGFKEFRNEVLLPVYTGNDDTLVLKSAPLCTYSNAEWLKDVADDEEGISYVHTAVDNFLAEKLGARPLTQTLMDDDVESEEWGQEEQLTTRIKNLLIEGYADGFSVPKELLQNADDAGAKQLCFLYDERENLDAQNRLLDEEMKGWQGPALWVYNDSTFSESDFQNITKLSGATKEADETKIGKFGLGFCSVYNLTDVPSFISGHNIVIFDPHTTYLGKALPGKRPGLKINIRKEKNLKMIHRMDQFKPFKGIFECDLVPSLEKPYFDGTLFRFPLRTNEQAKKSDISDITYNKKEMMYLLEKFMHDAGNLLLFTQNVSTIKIFHLPPGSKNAKNMNLLFEVGKVTTDAQEIDTSILRLVSDLKEQKRLETSPFKVMQELCIRIHTTEHAKMISKSFENGTISTKWIVSWANGTSNSAKMCYLPELTHALPVGGVAAMLNENESGLLLPANIKDSPIGFYKNGHIFCFLPLPMQTTLDFHINGCFSVTSNRRNFRTGTEDDKRSFETLWNTALFGDAVVNAYIHLLEGIRDRSSAGAYKYHTLWPIDCVGQISSFQSCFYKQLIQEDRKLFSTNGKWAAFSECALLDRVIQFDKNVGTTAFEVFQEFYSCDAFVAINVPENIRNILEKEHPEAVKRNTVLASIFLTKTYLPNIEHQFWTNRGKKKGKERDKLTIFALELEDESVRKAISETDCIPTIPNGVLKRPQELVEPGSSISQFFRANDERFPSEDFGSRQRVAIFAVLRELGMMDELLPVNLLLERASSIETLILQCVDCGMERCRLLLKYLLRNKKEVIKVSEGLRAIRFLPVLRKPQRWPISLQWKGDESVEFEVTKRNHRRVCRQHRQSRNVGCIRLETPEHLFMHDCKNLAGCACLFVDESQISQVFGSSRSAGLKLLAELGVKNKSELLVETVVNELIQISGCNKSCVSVCCEIYGWLDKALESPSALMKIKSLQDKPIIFVGGWFVKPVKVALQLDYPCTPELYALKEEFKVYKNFLKVVGVRDRFEVADILKVLETVKEQSGDRCLDVHQMKLIRSLLSCLADIMDESSLNYNDLETYGLENVMAPDTCHVLRPTNQLCFDDCDFLRTKKEMLYISEDVPRNIATKLGVKSKRRRNILDYSIGIPFEQKEELVTRLSGLLEKYPCDVGIMKELLQNADDAKATEVHFIIDLRKQPCGTIFDESYKKLQGPALCVYNNKGFTENDLNGIQNLGLGSKGDDPAKTGQYGVGFNSVYNLTDAPTFLTKGKEINGGEAFCLFDPLNIHLEELRGRRINSNSDGLKDSYPDVFNAYHEESIFNTDEGTMFRFPLRTEPSRLSRHVIDSDRVEKLLVDFQKEIFEMLLFLKNVLKVSVSDIDISSGVVKLRYCAEVIIDEEAKVLRQKHFDKIRKTAKCLRESPQDFLKENFEQIDYEVTVTDGKKEKRFYLVQGVGFKNEIPDSLASAYLGGYLGLLPMGGVSTELPRKTSKGMYAADCAKSRAFCFLPLPGFSGLPVHINGHFALDPEARRSLWKDERSRSYKTEWNEYILKEIIAEAYLKALVHARCYIFADSEDGLENEVIHQRLQIFHMYFPDGKAVEDHYWKYLADCTLKGMAKNEIPLFPVVLDREENKFPLKQQQINWEPLQKRGYRFPVYFRDSRRDNSNSRYLIENTGKNLGLKLVSSPSIIRRALANANVETHILTPDVMVAFLKSFNDETIPDRAKMGALPCNVANTEVKKSETVRELLRFCSATHNFADAIFGLPLLLTNDFQLQVFDQASKVFCSKFCGLLPHCAREFVHTDLVAFSAGLPRGVWKEFHLTDLSNKLSGVLSADVFISSTPVFFGENQIVPIEWLREFWLFVEKENQKVNPYGRSDVFWSMMHCLEHWCLLPAEVGEQSCMVQIKKSHLIVKASSFTFRPALLEIVCKLCLPELDRHLVPFHLQSFVDSFCATSDNPLCFLDCLYDTKDQLPQAELLPVECNVILTYFDEMIGNLGESQKKLSLKEKLKSLPLFATFEDEIISLQTSRTVIVLPRLIPTIGIEDWATNTKTILLRQNASVARLHEFLGFTFTSAEDFYIRYLFREWSKFPKEAIVTHLRHIRDHMLPKFSLFCMTEVHGRMVEAMKDLPCIVVEGERNRACQFFDPHHEVFKEMCSQDQFPPKEFCLTEWSHFLQLIGIKQEVTGQMFLGFAQTISQLADNNGSNADIARKSKALVQHLFSLQDIFGVSGIMESLSTIKFIPPHIVDQKLQDVFPQLDGGRVLISFANSISCRHSNKCWTCLNLLPEWAVPKESCNDLFNKLKIHVDIPVEKFLLHCQYLCEGLKSFIAKRNKQKCLDWVADLMETHYEHLSANVLKNEDAKTQLAHTPMIYFPQRQNMVQARQVVVEMTSEDEIMPYLYKAPSFYGKYFDLFQHLGAFPKCTYMCYAHVLTLLKNDVKDRTLMAPDYEKIKRAVKGLMSFLPKTGIDSTGDLNDEDVLFLPGENKKLVDATKLVYSNHSTFEKRIKQSVDINFFTGFEELEIQERDPVEQLQKFPRKHQPSILTDIVDEITDTSEILHIQNQEAIQLEEFLHSNEFLQGVLRLVKHAKRATKQSLTWEDETVISNSMRKIRIQEVTGLKTYLTYKGERLERSEDKKNSFACKMTTSTSEEPVWNIYFQVVFGGSGWFQTVYHDLLQVIDDVTGKCLKENQSRMTLMLYKRDHPEEISSLLDQQRIDAYNLPMDLRQTVFPVPGEYVPKEFHPFLNNGFSVFEEHEYRSVALELDDEELDNQGDTISAADDRIMKEPVYIYVRIIIKVENIQKLECPEIFQRYKIFTGETEKEVPAFFLYKLIRPESKPASEIVAADKLPIPQDGEDVMKAKYSIRHFLIHVRKQKLSRKDQRRIIKRLYLQWHPDKNIGKEEFCKQVFAYLKELVWKLENGEPFDEDDVIEDSDYSGYSGYRRSSGGRRYADFASTDYFQFFNRMDNRARSHRKYRSSYTFRQPTTYEPIPDPGEARRWLAQAKIDLRTARESLTIPEESPAFNWVCYKCHQAAEKGLKAVVYNRDAREVPKKIHDLRYISWSLGSGLDDLRSKAAELQSHVGNHARMRYPDSVGRPNIPSDLFTKEEANKALELAKEILDRVAEECQ